MVKPALPYLDIVSDLAAAFPLPVLAYQVSGEYAMIQAAAKNGWIDRQAAICETAVSIFRAGAGGLITYFAPELAGYMREGRIG